MFMPSSSETADESAVRVSPSVRVPVMTRSPVGASLTSVTLTVTSCVSDSRSPAVDAATVNVMLGEVSWSKLADSLTVMAHVETSMSKFPASSPAVMAQFWVVSFIIVGDHTLALDATSSAIEAVAAP